MPIPPSPRSLARTFASMLVAGAALLVHGTTIAGAQRRAPQGPAAARADSITRLDAARRAQRAFERLWRASLPVTDAGGRHACDATVGRYCYWHDDEARPPATHESPRVAAGRRRLLATLDSMAARQPGDRWITGQRVRYRLDAGDTTSAVRAASACTAIGWWCPALLGFARHAAGDHHGANLAFATATSAMREDERCAWENPAVLLEPAVRRRMDALPCAARRRAAERLWWLATPLLSRVPNDFRTEFLARRTASLLEADARHVYDTSWGWDTNELLLRYGWPVWWSRERRVALQGHAEPHLVGHEASPSFDFLPSARLFTDTAAIPAPDDWQPARPLPSARYAAPHVRSWTNIEAQLARLVRGDTVIVLAAFDAGSDTLLDAPAARLVVSPAPGARPYLSPPQPVRAGVAEVRVPRAALGGIGLAGVEVVDSVTRAVARYRAGITAPAGGRLALSDLILHHPADSPAGAPELGRVMRVMLPGLRITGDRVAFYWETYGLAGGGELLDVALQLERTQTPWLTRAAVRVGLATRATPLQVRWRESPGGSRGVAARAVTVDLADMAPGEYRVTLSVRADDGSTARTSRVVVVAR